VEWLSNHPKEASRGVRPAKPKGVAVVSTIGQDLRPAEFLVAARALTTSVRLLMLDKAWTREAALASDTDTRDDGRLAELDPLVDEMDRLFAECRDLAPKLVEVASRDGSDLQTKFEALLTDLENRGERTTEIARRLRYHVESKGGGRALDYLRVASDQLQERAGLEVQQMREELARVRGGTASAGDMSSEAEAVVTVLAIAATAEFGPLGGAVVEGVAYVVDCLTS
jgi:hypothetical protein